VEFLLFSWFLVTQLATQLTKKILVFLGVLYTIFYVAFTFYTKAFTSTDSIPENTAIIDSIPIGIEAIIVLVFSFYYLYEQMRDTTNMFIYNTFQFWIVLGMVLYLAGSFFIYIFSNNLSGDDVKKYWVITNFFSILRSIFFTIAIIQHAKPTKNRLLADFEVSYLN
jgi:Na+-driven multidrug efflux pump